MNALFYGTNDKGEIRQGYLKQQVYDFYPQGGGAYEECRLSYQAAYIQALMICLVARHIKKTESDNKFLEAHKEVSKLVDNITGIEYALTRYALGAFFFPRTQNGKLPNGYKEISNNFVKKLTKVKTTEDLDKVIKNVALDIFLILNMTGVGNRDCWLLSGDKGIRAYCEEVFPLINIGNQAQLYGQNMSYSADDTETEKKINAVNLYISDRNYKRFGKKPEVTIEFTEQINILKNIVFKSF